MFLAVQIHSLWSAILRPQFLASAASSIGLLGNPKFSKIATVDIVLFVVKRLDRATGDSFLQANIYMYIQSHEELTILIECLSIIT